MIGGKIGIGVPHERVNRPIISAHGLSPQTCIGLALRLGKDGPMVDVRGLGL